MGNTFASILQLMVQRGASIGECSMFPKICSRANEYGSFKKKKGYEHTHELINRNHTTSQYMQVWRKNLMANEIE